MFGEIGYTIKNLKEVVLISQNEILAYLKDIKPSLQKEGIAEIALFGSFAKKVQTDNSDIDIVIGLEKDYLKTHDVWSYFDLLNACKQTIAQHFHTKVDIFDKDCSSSIKEYILDEAIYA